MGPLFCCLLLTCVLQYRGTRDFRLDIVVLQQTPTVTQV